MSGIDFRAVPGDRINEAAALLDGMTTEQLQTLGCLDPHYCGLSPDNVKPSLFMARCYRCSILKARLAVQHWPER